MFSKFDRDRWLSVKGSAVPASCIIQPPRSFACLPLCRGSRSIPSCATVDVAHSGPAMHASAAAAASSASSSADRDSPMAQARCPSPAGSVASCSASVSVAAPSPVVPSLSRLIFDGELEAAAKSERVLSVHGCVKEVQTIRRRQVEALFKCENEECALIIMWRTLAQQHARQRAGGSAARRCSSRSSCLFVRLLSAQEPPRATL